MFTNHSGSSQDQKFPVLGSFYIMGRSRCRGNHGSEEWSFESERRSRTNPFHFHSHPNPTNTLNSQSSSRKSKNSIKLLNIWNFSFLLLSLLSFGPASSTSSASPQIPSAYGDTPDRHRNHFTDQWAVHIVGGMDRAHEIASKHGFVNTGEVRSTNNFNAILTSIFVYG